MPLRTRSHELEEESRRAFRNALPTRWVFRDTVPDYGLDGEVEVFDEVGRQTGDLFKVQLKATDEPHLERALAVRVPEEHRQYWGRLDLPVLVVRYHSPTGRIFFAWAHEFDPYYGRGAESVHTFRIPETDEWGADSPARLAAELTAIRRFRRAELVCPMEVSVSVLEPQLHGVAGGLVFAAIVRTLGRVSGYLRVAPEVHAGTPSITVSGAKTVVRVPGLPSSTLHTEGEIPENYWEREYPNDVVVLIALILAKSGHVKVAVELLLDVARDSRLIRRVEIASALAGALARARLVREAVAIAECVGDDAHAASVILSLPALAHGSTLSSGERAALVALHESRLQRARGSEEATAIATAHYNLGSVLSRTALRKAVHHYHRAVVDDPRYAERAYFFQELGAILFHASRFRAARRFYERAIALGAKPMQGRLADALLFSGLYGAAREGFRRSGGETEEPEAEWWLKEKVVAFIMARLGVEAQARDVRRAAEVVASIAGEASDEIIGERMRSALQYDGLCAVAWHNLGVLSRKRGESASAFDEVLAAAVLEPTFAKAWILVFGAMGSPADEEGMRLIEKITAVAFRHAGAELVPELARLAADAPSEISTASRGQEMVRAAAEMAARYGRVRPGAVLRLVGTDEYREIPIGPAPTDDE